MKISEAVALIRNPSFERPVSQSWCDLGCGKGTFTLALAQSLAPGSTIHAVDLDSHALGAIPDEYYGVAIRKVLGDLRSTGSDFLASTGFSWRIHCTSFKTSPRFCGRFCLLQIAF